MQQNSAKLYNRLLSVLVMLNAAGVRAQGGDPPTVGLQAFAAIGSYSQTSSNSQQASSDHSKSVKVGGQGANFSLNLAQVETNFSYQALKASGSDWYKSRTDSEITFGWHFAAAPWLMPIAGLYQEAQTGDSTQLDAPIDFINKNESFLIGTKMQGMFFAGDGQGLYGQAQLAYLSDGQAKVNFGVDQQVALGYGYRAGTMNTGLTLGTRRTYYNATATGTSTDGFGSSVAATKNVRQTLQTTMLTLFFAY